MKGSKYLVLAKSLLIVTLLSIALALEIILVVSFFQANASAFSIMPIVDYARGWEKFWMWIFLAADAGYLLILGLMFLELALFLLRTMIASALKALAAMSKRDPVKQLAAIKKVSLITLFKKMRIDTPTRAIIAYIALMVVVLGSGWVAKKVLTAEDSLVYRSYAVINLASQELSVDVADEIEDGATYDIVVRAGVANVHVYTVKDATAINVYFLYDTEVQKDSLVWSVDTDLDTVTVAFSPLATSYEKYVDPLPAAVEIYLPDDLDVDAIDVELTHYGNLTVEYVVFQSLEADVAKGVISVAETKNIVGDVRLVSRGGRINASIDACAAFQADLHDGADMSATLGEVAGSFGVLATDGSDVVVYSTVAAAIDITTGSSAIELREVYAPEVTITLAPQATLLYMNGDAGYAYGVFAIDAAGGTVTTKGVPA